MAHEITIRDNGMAEMAFTGPRDAIWHGLGQNLEVGAPLEKWKVAAGMDFEVFESAVTFQSGNETHVFPGRKALFRSDTNAPLAIVGEDFKIVQPDDVIEFFRDLVKLNGMELSTAGTLFGGKRFWALAEMGGEEDIVAGDTVKQHLLLTTAVDGSMATTGKVVCTRVVCNNTLTVALGSRNSAAVRVTHKRQFDPTQVKIDLGLIDQAWANMIKDLRKLANTPMSAADTRRFYEEQFYDPDKTVDEQSWGAVRNVNRLVTTALHGSGSDMSKGTRWGALCAATEWFTHGTGKRDASHQFWDAYHGDLETKKYGIYRDLIRA